MIKPFNNDEIVDEFKQAKKILDNDRESFQFSSKKVYYEISLD